MKNTEYRSILNTALDAKTENPAPALDRIITELARIKRRFRRSGAPTNVPFCEGKQLPHPRNQSATLKMASIRVHSYSASAPRAGFKDGNCCELSGARGPAGPDYPPPPRRNSRGMKAPKFAHPEENRDGQYREEKVKPSAPRGPRVFKRGQ